MVQVRFTLIAGGERNKIVRLLAQVYRRLIVKELCHEIQPN